MDSTNRDIDPVLATLTAKSDPRIKRTIVNRFGAMVRELNYLDTSGNERLLFMRTRAWTDQKLRVLFALNCVYQVLLGPLHASTRGGKTGIGTTIPIVYGSLTFDTATAGPVNAALADFGALVQSLGFEIEWLTANTCGDLLYFIQRTETARGEEA